MRRCELAVAVTVVALTACKRHDTKSAARGMTVPRTSGPIKIDGEWDEDDWPNRALRVQLAGADGELARPSSEARFLRDERDLIVALYAADENIQSTDVFELALGSLVLKLDATGRALPSVPGMRIGVDRDGTLDDAHDDDEEWVIEAAIPLTSLGSTKDLSVRTARCDVTKDGVKRCGAWSGTLALE